jgi:hypothetical protein
MINQEINIVIINEFLEGNEDLIYLLFGTEEIQYISGTMDMYDILVKFDLFSSKGNAKKNWTKSKQDVPDGFNIFNRIGKYRIDLYIWKPTEILNSEVMTICKKCNKKSCDGCKYENLY